MKTFISICLLFLFIQAHSQQVTKNELSDYESVVALVNSKDFSFTANHALPQNGPTIDLFSNPNELTIKGDSVFCYMPFFGRAYNIDYNDQGGFHFSGIIENYKKIEKAQKKKIEIRFNAQSRSDSYQFHLTISGGKSSVLTILSSKRASISYWGEINEPKK
ncbi:MAG TPA: DUF4251 domain-containing protein [Prolixibacteraceae bacterium]|nr:DUF4251 domain-containing protein [Prolixibacteraceae bacterium]